MHALEEHKILNTFRQNRLNLLCFFLTKRAKTSLVPLTPRAHILTGTESLIGWSGRQGNATERQSRAIV